MIGLSFTIPNEYGRYLFDILKPIHPEQYFWLTGGEEAYYIEDNELGTPLFPKTHVYAGVAFYKRISEKDYYAIFADLKAFKDRSHVKDITTYDEFLNSQCEIALLLVDSCYVTIYAKNVQHLSALHRQAIVSNFEDVAYITEENDDRTRLKTF